MNKYEEALSQLELAIQLLVDEGPSGLSEKVEKIVGSMHGYGSLYPPHKTHISQVIRLLAENGVHDSKAAEHLNKAHECF